MGAFDFGPFFRTLGGSGKETLPITLLPGEAEKLRVVASRNPGQLNSVGGDLVLTTQRLIFTPLNVKDVAAILSLGLTKAGAPEAIRTIPEKLAVAVGETVSIGPGKLADIVRVEAGSNGSVWKPPTLIVFGTDGSTTELGVLAGRTSPNMSSKNPPVRDRVLAEIKAM